MTLLARLAKVSGLNGTPHLKQALKKTLDRCRDPFDRGVPLAIGDVAVRVPARFARQPWTRYEPAATAHVASWLDARPDAALIDVGCSVALYSLLALARCPRGEAWAIDADPVSLQASRWLCRHAGPQRLHVIRGYIGDVPTLALSARDAAAQTDALLASGNIPAEPALATYTCLDSQAVNAIPIHCIDRLFADATTDRPWLIKIDVEGAEMLVLRGSDDFVRRVRPQLLVSVHPPALRAFGLAPDDVAAWLRARRYTFAVDVEPHEQHWWCSPGV